MGMNSVIIKVFLDMFMIIDFAHLPVIAILGFCTLAPIFRRVWSALFLSVPSLQFFEGYGESFLTTR